MKTLTRALSHVTHRSRLDGGRSPSRSTSVQAAFTIVEVAMATFVLALAITTAITTLQHGFLSLDTARNTTISGQIMQSEMEKIRLRAWSDIAAYSTSGRVGPITIDTSFTANAFIGDRFKLYRNVTVVPTGTSAGMREITLTCEWESYDGRTLSRSYTIYYGQNGLYDYFYNYY